MGGAGVCGSEEGGAVGRAWKGEQCGGVNRLAGGQGGVARAWEAWKCLHWLSRMEAFSFHSAQVIGMGCSQ